MLFYKIKVKEFHRQGALEFSNLDYLKIYHQSQRLLNFKYYRNYSLY